jgi:hypothetical protein
MTSAEHDHTWRLANAQVKAPTGPAPEHTVFVVLVCACGVFDPFPRSNWELATADFRADFVATMAASGLQLAPAPSRAPDAEASR